MQIKSERTKEKKYLWICNNNSKCTKSIIKKLFIHILDKKIKF